jgi:hypothetical protein
MILMEAPSLAQAAAIIARLCPTWPPARERSLNWLRAIAAQQPSTRVMVPDPDFWPDTDVINDVAGRRVAERASDGDGDSTQALSPTSARGRS